MNIKRLAILGAALLVVGLSGCATSTGTHSASPTHRAVPHYASEKQVSSVLATYAPDWHDVIDKAGDCRYLWSFGATSVAEKAEAVTCGFKEETIGLTSQITVKKWNGLKVPPSMTDLVDSTSAILTQIGAIDFDAVCGTDLSKIDTQPCSDALGTRNGLYVQLDTQLNAWSPYLG